MYDVALKVVVGGGVEVVGGAIAQVDRFEKPAGETQSSSQGRAAAYADLGEEGTEFFPPTCRYQVYAASGYAAERSCVEEAAVVLNGGAQGPAASNVAARDAAAGFHEGHDFSVQEALENA
jgi:hypothetical protein